MSARSTPGTTVGIVGVGYMGIATALAFARKGRRVVAYDINRAVRASLRAGRSPYHEAGLEALLRSELRRGRFRVVDRVGELARESDVLFLCVPTPCGSGGKVDLSALRAAVRELGQELRGSRGYRLVVVKSTVVPGTTQTVVEPLIRKASGLGAAHLGVASNPEFLAEGQMVKDALFPERVVAGVRDAKSLRVLSAAYAGFDAPIFALTPSGAELVKYASNSFLALKVSFSNELSRWSERLGENVDSVAAAVGADPRIGSRFLRAGPGFGGSCFDKDLRAWVARGKELSLPARAAETALLVNAEQTDHVFELVRQSARSLRGKTVAVLGLAFKPGTDDVRESRAFPLIERLLESGARVRAHDPVAIPNFRRQLRRASGGQPRRITFCSTPEGALRGADLAVLQADWPEYLEWPARWTELMRTPVLLDLRRALRAEVARRARLRVASLGVGTASPHSTGPSRAARPRRGT